MKLSQTVLPQLLLTPLAEIRRELFGENPLACSHTVQVHAAVLSTVRLRHGG